MNRGTRILTVVAFAAVAVILSILFRPAAMQAAAGFDALVGFYVITQAAERVIEIIFWALMVREEDRKNLGLVLGFVFGALASSYFGLYFLGAVTDFDPDGGGGANRALDVLVTGLVVAGGSKPLHDLITLISAKKEEAKEEVPPARRALV